MTNSTYILFFVLTLFLNMACDDDNRCGDGKINEAEQCDGRNLAGHTCVSQGFTYGGIGCNSDCTLNTDLCFIELCNNGILDEGESCDGTGFTDNGCEDFGFFFGDLACDENCEVDVSACLLPDTCGNGTIDINEECDLDDLDSATCESLGFAPGGSLSCSANCRLDVTACTPPQNCGNGTVDDHENCDGSLSNGESCLSLGYSADGVVQCGEDCLYNVSECPTCYGTDPNYGCDINNDNCCPKDGQPYACGKGPWDIEFCEKACVSVADCGFNEDCYLGDGVCSFRPCQFPNSNCLLSDNSTGYCQKTGYALMNYGLCVTEGVIRHGGECTPYEYGTFPFDPFQSCQRGYCETDEETPDMGRCRQFCDAEMAMMWMGDNCPVGYNCLNISELIKNDPDGFDNFRIADIGACHAMFDGMEGLTSKGMITCDLLTHKQYKTGLDCPEGLECGVRSKASLMGVCKSPPLTPKALNESCDPESEEPECSTGLSCMESDPLNDPDSGYSCLRICDATTENNNTECEEISLGNDLICLTTSRFYTQDHSIPSNYGMTETAPSPLGFCVPTP
jgi:hypothetical protein